MHELGQISRSLYALRVELADVKYELACRRFVAELKAHFNPSQPRAPRGSSNGGEWVDAGGGAGSAPRSIPVQYRPPGGGRRGPGAPPSGPLAEHRIETFNRTLGEIRRLEPGNSHLQYAAPPNYVPNNRTVNRTVEELEAARDRAAERIAGHGAARGHGADFGGATRLDLYGIVRRTITNPQSRSEALPRGRNLYYDRRSNTLVIVDPNSPSGGSVYRPPRGERYVNELVQKR